MEHKFETRKLETDEKVLAAIDAIINLFNEKQFTPDQCNAVLSFIAAAVIDGVQREAPKARGREKEFAGLFADAILKNLARLQKGNNN